MAIVTEIPTPDLHVFDIYGGGEDTVIAYDAEDARAIMLEMVPAADLENAAFKQHDDDAGFTFCELEGEPPITKTCGEWAKEKGRGYFASSYA